MDFKQASGPPSSPFLSPERRSAWSRYGAAVGIAGAACALREAFSPVWGPIGLPFIFFWPVVVLAAWYGRRGPGMVALASSALLADWIFIAPRWSLIPSTLQGGLELVVFIAVGLVLVFVIEGMHQANALAWMALRERERLTHELEERVEERTSQVESAPNAIVMIDSQGRIAVANVQAESLFGYGRKELLGLDVDTLVPQGIRDKYREFRRVFLAAPKPIRIGVGHDLSCRRKDGREVSVEIGLNPMATPRGRFILASIVDVTERRRFERRQSALAEVSRVVSERLDLSKHLERIPRVLSSQFAQWCVLALKGASGELRRTALCHRDPERTRWARETLAPLFLDAQAPAGVPRVVSTGRAEFYPDLGESALQAIGLEAQYIEFLREIGARSAVIVPLRATERVLGALALVRGKSQEPFDEADVEAAQAMADRTALALENERIHDELAGLNVDLERRIGERTRELNETVQELQGFSYTVAHDLRAPLRAMQGFAELVLEDAGSRLHLEEREYLQRITVAAHRMDTLVRDLLEYSRLGMASVHSEVVNLGTLVQEVLWGMDSELAGREAEVSVEKGIPEVVAHRAILAQVLTNLISNAAKFVAPGILPRIRIAAQTCGERVRVLVEDNGIGVAREYHAKVFGVFERLHAGDTYPGTGIGLAIVKRAVERMGGRVGLESEVGRGSIFWFELPAAPEGPRAAREADNPGSERTDPD